jgi:hypothetical protein
MIPDTQVSADDALKIYHQNIRGLRNKTTELINSLPPEFPQILCITEHHLKEPEVERTPLIHYNLEAKFYGENLKHRGKHRRAGRTFLTYCSRNCR